MEPPRSSPPDSEARPSPLPPASARWLVCGGRRRASSRAGMPPGGKLQGAGGPLAPPRGREETRRFPREPPGPIEAPGDILTQNSLIFPPAGSLRQTDKAELKVVKMTIPALQLRSHNP